jgi:hypothetical protein
MADTMTSQNIDLSSWDTLYNGRKLGPAQLIVYSSQKVKSIPLPEYSFLFYHNTTLHVTLWAEIA